MARASARVLKKIFVDGFYRTHSGMLLFGFVMLVSYCLFINTLGAVPLDQIDFWQFFFTVSLVSNPLILVFYLLVSLLYAYKTWQFIRQQINLQPQHFLRYSFNSLSKNRQFLHWFFVQFYVFIPVLAYTLYAIIIGLVFGYYLISIIIVGFQLILIAFVAHQYQRTNTSLIETDAVSWISKLSKSWRKPVFFLFSYEVFHRLKLAYSLTKGFSWLLMASILFVFADLKEDSRFLMLVTACIALAHIILIYQERVFNLKYLSFLHNFPLTKTKLFLGFSLNYFILLLPEIVWILVRFPMRISICLVVFVLSAILLFRAIILISGQQIKSFLIWSFSIFICFYLLIMFGFGLYLIPLNLIISWLIFRKKFCD
ncbi:hypothetical protein ACJVDH_03265 [Pedobacter sp. AW1-32]|uniref:hypothetical protein n=1 Tax=Pedobacter sp. AW1-32 TaxID=3383026 RepID=UPI003FED44F9